MPEYFWMYLNKQDSEDVSGPKYSKILNIAKFWIWQCSHYVSIAQRSEYARICLDRVLNISWVLNMPGFWIWESSKYGRATQGGSKYATMWLNMFVGREYAWMCLTVQ